MIEGFKIPSTTFRVRSGDSVLEQGCSFDEGTWATVSTDEYFKGKRVVLFSLPGAFTPTCSSTQLPGFETHYKAIKTMGIDEIYCCSVNDTFVMNAWATDQNLKNVKMIPDGNGEFAQGMGMLCQKRDKCFGQRSWRYAMVVNDGNIEAMFIEPGKTDDTAEDPYHESSPESVMQYLKDFKG